ncbi:hypothetical protein RsTz2092_06180 [Deferribacterales bacterium RsTz2092]|nr:hypothetical protein AGMMS49941_03050 [Deferribacterales bacterium]
MFIFKVLYFLVALCIAGSIYFLVAKPPTLTSPQQDNAITAANTPISNSGRPALDTARLRAQAGDITRFCGDNLECRAVVLFRRVVADFRDITPQAAATLTEYMESVGLDVRIAKADDGRDYPLACGLSSDKLYEYVRDDELKTPLYSDTMLVAGKQYWVKALNVTSKTKLAIKVKSNVAVDVYMVDKPVGIELDKATCVAKGLADDIVECVVGSSGTLVLYVPADANIGVSIAVMPLERKDVVSISYRNERCIPFDPNNRISAMYQGIVRR